MNEHRAEAERILDVLEAQQGVFHHDPHVFQVHATRALAHAVLSLQKPKKAKIAEPAEIPDEPIILFQGEKAKQRQIPREAENEKIPIPCGDPYTAGDRQELIDVLSEF